MAQMPKIIQDYSKLGPSDFEFQYNDEVPFGTFLIPYHNFTYTLLRKCLLLRDFVFGEFSQSSMRYYKNGDYIQSTPLL